MKIVIATKNQGKVVEINSIIGSTGIEAISLTAFPDMPEVVEDGFTFLDNARKKARETAIYTGLPSLADDSGLEVDALDGRPGVYSARFAPTTEERNAKLLGMLADTPDHLRTARFVCALAIASPDGTKWTTTGTCNGVITREPRGEQGFGYDPVFFYGPLGKTFAEIPRAEKNKISHRGLALAAFRDAVSDGLLDSRKGV